MTLTDIIVLLVIAAVVGGAAVYIIKAKKSGKKCIGCPDSCSCHKEQKKDACGGNCGSCSCGCHEENEQK